MGPATLQPFLSRAIEYLLPSSSRASTYPCYNHDTNEIRLKSLPGNQTWFSMLIHLGRHTSKLSLYHIITSQIKETSVAIGKIPFLNSLPARDFANQSGYESDGKSDPFVKRSQRFRLSKEDEDIIEQDDGYVGRQANEQHDIEAVQRRLLLHLGTP